MAKTEYDPFGDTIENKEKPRLKERPPEEKWIRKTFVIKDKYAALINRMAYWQRREKKDILNEILKGYFKNKKIKDYPE